MAANERRIGNTNVIRANSDRRVCSDANYRGPERRCGEERRTNKDRRKRS